MTRILTRSLLSLSPSSPGLVIFVLIAFCAIQALANTITEPQGYKLSDYKSPVPATLQGAQVVTATAAFDLWQNKTALFIDVLPRPPKPENLDETKWKQPKRLNIVGSYWLPNVGFGKINQHSDDYFQRNLKRLTNGNHEKPLVFYCLANCWMSWNAAKRALAYGYSHVIWFPGGTDEWQQANYPLEEKLPEEQAF